MACRRAKGTSVPMTAAVWRRRFSSDGKRSIRAARTACTVAGTWMLSRGLARREAPRSPIQLPGLDQAPNALLQEKWIALRARDQEPRERHEAGVVSQQGLQQFRG